jgi:hypothetical protein
MFDEVPGGWMIDRLQSVTLKPSQRIACSGIDLPYLDQVFIIQFYGRRSYLLGNFTLNDSPELTCNEMVNIFSD